MNKYLIDLIKKIKLFRLAMGVMVISLLIFSIGLSLISCSPQSGSPDLPEYSSYINDYTGTIGSDWIEDSESLAVMVEEETGYEIAVAIIASLEDIPIEEYSSNLFEKWGVGKKDLDNGVLLLIALDDRELRIEVGYGLEGVITDLEAGYIIEDIIIPEFKTGDYGRGIYNGIAAISNKVYEELGLPEVPYSENISSASKSSSGGIPVSAIIVIVVVLCANILPWVIIGSAGGIAAMHYRRKKYRCPQCGKIGLSIVSKILKNPTYEYPGKMQIEKTCRYCGFLEKSIQVLPKKYRSVSTDSSFSGFTSTDSSSSFSSSSSSSGSSSSSFGGFGGGSSGGAGASGRW